MFGGGTSESSRFTEPMGDALSHHGIDATVPEATPLPAPPPPLQPRGALQASPQFANPSEQTNISFEQVSALHPDEGNTMSFQKAEMMHPEETTSPLDLPDATTNDFHIESPVMSS
eukprot:2911776-Prymnesium_polylepis.3